MLRDSPEAASEGGCDYQRGHWLIGVAGDWDWASATNSSANAFFPLLTDVSKVKSLASLTFRGGYAWDRFLFYVKGGGAWLQSDFDVQAAGTAFGTVNDTRRRWTVGVGGEYAVNWGIFRPRHPEDRLLWYRKATRE